MNPKLAVRETRRYGKGVFVQHGSMKRGEFLFVLGGHVLTVQDETRLDRSLFDKPIEIAEGFSIGPRSRRDLARMPQHYVNHSCSPNAGFHGQIFLVALRPIRRDEEITYDYAMVMRNGDSHASGFKMRCSCGSSQCRGIISGDDWRNPKLQRRYAGYFQWYLQERIKALRARPKR
jgi:hypothetical protein